MFSKADARLKDSYSGDSLSDTGGYAISSDDYDPNMKMENGSMRQVKQQPQVPPLITACIDHLTKYGLNVVGIFRVSTSKRRIREVSAILAQRFLHSHGQILHTHKHTHTHYYAILMRG